MENKKRIIEREVLIGLIVLICISNISAFAISSDYWRENPLRLYPGESKEFSLILQNLGGSSDLNLRAVVATGSDILRVADSSNTYTVPAGQKGVANFIATLPSDAKPGQVYNVKIDFSEIKDSKSGEFGFGTAIGQSFDIITLPEEKPTGLNKTLIFSIAAGIVVLIILIIILRKIKKGKPHRKLGKKR